MKPALLPALALGLVAAGAPTPTTVSFDDQKPGESPKGFSCVLTGKGRPGAWTIVTDALAPSPPYALGQTDEDPTGYRFPVCVLDAFSAADLDLSVRFRPMKGSADQAAGIVWRFRDKDNYYLLRANALESNLVLYKVEAGRRSDLKPKGSGMFAYGKRAKVPSGVWGTLRVVARGPLFEAYLNGEKLFDVEDRTFSGPGQVGVWTKADSVTYFDNLRVVGEK